MSTNGVPRGGGRLLRHREAAAYLGISERSLWTMGSTGEIPQVRFGGGSRQSVRYDIGDLDAWIDARKRKGGRRA